MSSNKTHYTYQNHLHYFNQKNSHMIPNMMANTKSTQAILTAALSSLPPSQLSHLTHRISTASHHHRRRLAALLVSQPLFTLTLHHLQSLSLHQKSLLISHHLHSHLSLLSAASTPPPAALNMKLRDLDSVLLLLLLCETHQHHPKLLHAPPSRWRVALLDYFFDSILQFSTFACSSSDVISHYIESVSTCWNFVNVMGCGDHGKERSEVAASAAAVVGLPSVEAEGGECVICKEEMGEGREVCELPCKHRFHWTCILRWLKKRNTCPCCRHRLPTDDVRREIERLMDDLVRIGGGGRLCDVMDA